jgi:hypothetical protein
MKLTQHRAIFHESGDDAFYGSRTVIEFSDNCVPKGRKAHKYADSDERDQQQIFGRHNATSLATAGL